MAPRTLPLALAIPPSQTMSPLPGAWRRHSCSRASPIIFIDPQVGRREAPTARCASSHSPSPMPTARHFDDPRPPVRRIEARVTQGFWCVTSIFLPHPPDLHTLAIIFISQICMMCRALGSNSFAHRRSCGRSQIPGQKRARAGRSRDEGARGIAATGRPRRLTRASLPTGLTLLRRRSDVSARGAAGFSRKHAEVRVPRFHSGI